MADGSAETIAAIDEALAQSKQARVHAALDAIAQVQRTIMKPRSHAGQAPYIWNGEGFCLEASPKTVATVPDMIGKQLAAEAVAIQHALTLPVGAIVTNPFTFETLSDHMQWRTFTAWDADDKLNEKKKALMRGDAKSRRK
jgi:hypothetical protein